MPLMKWDPDFGESEPFRGLRREVDRLFDEFFHGSPLRQIGEWAVPGQLRYFPAVDLEETDQELVLTAEVPGVSKDSLDVNITEGQVAIKGERKPREETKDISFHRKELRTGAFDRVVDLPVPIVPDKVLARVEDGILTLTMPKSEPAKRKVVKVKID